MPYAGHDIDGTRVTPKRAAILGADPRDTAIDLEAQPAVLTTIPGAGQAWCLQSNALHTIVTVKVTFSE
jgi:hypothetical protein